MLSATALEIVVPDDVIAEVRRKNSEVEFNAFRDVVANHFPHAQAFSLRLLEDPDEEDRSWVVFEVRILHALTPAEYTNEIKSFYSKLSESRSHVSWTICTLDLQFGDE